MNKQTEPNPITRGFKAAIEIMKPGGFKTNAHSLIIHKSSSTIRI